MVHRNKARGNELEREVVNKAKEFGFDAKRAFASNGEALGEVKEVDLIINADSRNWRIQAKRKKKLPQFLAIDKGVDAVVFREDRGQAFLLLPLNTFLEVMRECDRRFTQGVCFGIDNKMPE